ncbi:hypothetical protein J6590_048334 [Homalodisca vitripennis]|nr:hypothetical protein J6590_048334 [Homalodisca vitripennis]
MRPEGKDQRLLSILHSYAGECILSVNAAIKTRAVCPPPRRPAFWYKRRHSSHVISPRAVIAGVVPSTPRLTPQFRAESSLCCHNARLLCLNTSIHFWQSVFTNNVPILPRLSTVVAELKRVYPINCDLRQCGLERDEVSALSTSRALINLSFMSG